MNMNGWDSVGSCDGFQFNNAAVAQRCHSPDLPASFLNRHVAAVLKDLGQYLAMVPVAFMIATEA